MRLFRQQHGGPPGVAARDESLQPPSAWIESLHLFVLATFGVTQPVYDRLAQRPMFLADSQVGAQAILMLMLIMSLLIPALVPAALWCAGRMAPRARAPLYAVAVYLLLLLIALPIAKRLENILPAWLTIGLGLSGAGVATWSYFAWGRLRSVVTATSPGIVVFPALFLFFSPIAALFATATKIETSSWKPVPIVMVVFDELCGMTLENEEGGIDSQRFPHFAELARNSTWYRNATTVSHETAQALPALLSGKRPSSSLSALVGPADLPQNLFSLLKSTGDYEFAVFEPISKLAPENKRGDPAMIKSSAAQLSSIVPTLARVFLVHLAPSELQRRLPEIPRLWFGFHDIGLVDRQLCRGVFRYRWGNDRRGQFEHFLDCLDHSTEPALHFFHVLLPHVPWCYLPSGRRYLNEVAQYELLDFDTHSGKMNFWGTDELFVAQSQQRYLLQLQFSDSLLGQLFARLRAVGLYDKCLLVVTADHGISFRVGQQRREATPGNAADILSVPLFIKLPGQQAGAMNDRNVESVDILPTIAQVLRIKLPMPVDGHSLVDGSIPQRTEKVFVASFGERMSFPCDVLKDRTVVHELHARFGSSADPGGMYRIGPHSELIGHSVADFELADDSTVEMELRRFQTQYSDDRDALVPCYFEGKVLSPRSIPAPMQIAIAVNGIIQSVTRTYEFVGLTDRWTALVPEQAFQIGENDVQVYTISGQTPELRCTRCTVQAASPD